MISIKNYTRIRFFGSSAIVVAVISLLLFSAKAEELAQVKVQDAVPEPVTEAQAAPAVQDAVKDKAALTAEFDQAFQQMLADPANVDITLNYAKIAVSLGNYEAAIPPLERILIFNPNLPKIKLQLGVLYYKLDSLKMAKSYLQDAVKSKDSSDEIRAGANEYLEKIKG